MEKDPSLFLSGFTTIESFWNLKTFQVKLTSDLLFYPRNIKFLYEIHKLHQTKKIFKSKCTYNDSIDCFISSLGLPNCHIY